MTKQRIRRGAPSPAPYAVALRGGRLESVVLRRDADTNFAYMRLLRPVRVGHFDDALLGSDSLCKGHRPLRDVANALSVGGTPVSIPTALGVAVGEMRLALSERHSNTQISTLIHCDNQHPPHPLPTVLLSCEPADVGQVGWVNGSDELSLVGVLTKVIDVGVVEPPLCIVVSGLDSALDSGRRHLCLSFRRPSSCTGLDRRCPIRGCANPIGHRHRR